MAEENFENQKENQPALTEESVPNVPEHPAPVEQSAEVVKEEAVAAPEAMKEETLVEPLAETEQAAVEVPAEDKAEDKAENKVEDKAEEELPARPKEAESTEERRWYVLQTYSGQEDKVKANIERTVAQANMGHKIFRVLVPEEETLEIKGSKRVERVRKMFPGYVFVEMLLDDESWYTIRQTPGVAKFIGSSVRPQPVIDREMQRVLKQIGVKGEKLEVAFEIGETVRVISGPFRGYTGSVNEVNADKGKLKILISIFGRDTPVEVNFEHAEKIS
jgi:transcriptional antiterminator NusG